MFPSRSAAMTACWTSSTTWPRERSRIPIRKRGMPAAIGMSSSAKRCSCTLEDRPRYNKTVCFDPFPFPDPDETLKRRIRDLGEQLDSHRKHQQSLHADLTITGMYNV